MKDEDRAALLRSRIVTLRQYLAEGTVRAETAAMYRREIARDERELALIAQRKPAKAGTERKV